MTRSPSSGSPPRQVGMMRNVGGRSPRARLTRGRSPRARSNSRGRSPKLHESARYRRSAERQRNGRHNNPRPNGRGGRGKNLSQRLTARTPHNGVKWGQTRKKRRRPRKGPPNLSGGNRQPVTSMRMRMDNYVQPKSGRHNQSDRGNEMGHVVARARKEASTRTKDTFWTKKLLDAEAQNGSSCRRWVHNGFKELYREELGYSDVDSDDGRHSRERFGTRDAKFIRQKEDTPRVIRKRSKSPRRSPKSRKQASKHSEAAPKGTRKAGRSPETNRGRALYSSSPTTSSSFSSSSSSYSRSVSGSSRSTSSVTSFSGSSASSVRISKSYSKSPKRHSTASPIKNDPKKTKVSRPLSVEPMEISTSKVTRKKTEKRRASDGEETVSDSSDDEPEPRKMTLSERFGKLAQLSSQRQEYEGVRMKIVREGGQDKKVYVEALRSPSKPKAAHEKWLREHKDEYDEYEKCYGQFRHWDPHRDLPRTIPQNWDDVNVRYAYYKESGYFGDRKITMEDYLKWEKWWYRYKHWLEKFGDTNKQWQPYDSNPRWASRTPREKRKRRRYH